jgi:hypothetical protein
MSLDVFFRSVLVTPSLQSKMRESIYTYFYYKGDLYIVHNMKPNML